MQFYPQPQPQYGGFVPQAQQCLSCPGYNNLLAGYLQQQQYPPPSALYPQQYFPQQQLQQQYSPFSALYPQQYLPQQQPQPQQQFYYPQQQQQCYYPQQQLPFYPQQQQQQWPQAYLGQNAYGNQQYWPQQQRVFGDPPTPSPSPKHHKKGDRKLYYEQYY